eukprot:SAG22_NODE_720_length_7649_cov_16.537616_2_plen_78_part_00
MPGEPHSNPHLVSYISLFWWLYGWNLLVLAVRLAGIGLAARIQCNKDELRFTLFAPGSSIAPASATSTAIGGQPARP